MKSKVVFVLILVSIRGYAASSRYTCESKVEVFEPPPSGEVCEGEAPPKLVDPSQLQKIAEPLHENLPAVRMELFEHLKRQALLNNLKNFFKARDKNKMIKNDHAWSLDLLPQDIKSCVNSLTNDPNTPFDDHYMDVSQNIAAFITSRNDSYRNQSDDQFNASKLDLLADQKKNLIEASEKLVQMEKKLSRLNAIMANIKAQVPPHLLMSGAWEPSLQYIQAQNEADMLAFWAYHIKFRYPMLSTAYLDKNGVELQSPKPGEKEIPLYKIIAMKMNDHRENPNMKSFGRRPMDWVDAFIEHASGQQGDLAIRNVEGLCQMSYSRDNLEHLVMTDGVREKVLKEHEKDPIFREVACEIVRERMPEPPSGYKAAGYLALTGLGCVGGWLVSGPMICIGTAGAIGTGIAGYEAYESISRALELSEDMPYIHDYFLASADEESGSVSSELFIEAPKQYNNDMFWGSVNLALAGASVSGNILFLNQLAAHSRKAAQEAMRLASLMRESQLRGGPSEIVAKLFSGGKDTKALSGFMKFIDVMDESTRREFQDTIGALTERSLKEGVSETERLVARNKALKILQMIDDNPHLTPIEIERMMAEELPQAPLPLRSEVDLSLRQAGGVRLGSDPVQEVQQGRVREVEWVGREHPSMNGTWKVRLIGSDQVQVYRTGEHGEVSYTVTRDQFRKGFQPVTRSSSLPPRTSTKSNVPERPILPSQRRRVPMPYSSQYHYERAGDYLIKARRGEYVGAVDIDGHQIHGKVARTGAREVELTDARGNSIVWQRNRIAYMGRSKVEPFTSILAETSNSPQSFVRENVNRLESGPFKDAVTRLRSRGWDRMRVNVVEDTGEIVAFEEGRFPSHITDAPNVQKISLIRSDELGSLRPVWKVDEEELRNVFSDDAYQNFMDSLNQYNER